MNSKVSKQLQKELRKLHNVDSILPDVSSLIVAIGAILVDSLLLFNLFNTLHNESFFLAIMITLMTSFALDFSPLVFSNAVLNYKEDKNDIDKDMMIASGAVFLVAILFSLILRFATVDIVYAPAAGLAGMSNEFKPGMEHWFVALLTGVIPVFTSIITLGFGLQSRTKKKKKILQKITLMNDIARLELSNKLEENTRILQMNLDELELQKKHDMDELTKQKSNLLNVIARSELAESLGTADATSRLLDIE